MRPAQHVASLAAASLSLTTIALIAPAGAVEPLASSSELKLSSYSNVVRYGDSAYLYADVRDLTSGYGIYETGTIRVQQSVAGGAWTDTPLTAPGGYKSFQVKPKATTSFRLVFSGGTNSRGVAYAPSTSTPVTYKVQRTGKYSASGRRVTVKLNPKAKNKKLVFKVSKTRDGKYKTYKSVRTNSQGKASITGPKGLRYWKVVVKKDAAFTDAVYQFSAYLR